MIKFLLKAILIVSCLVILVPLILLLFGETRLASRIFGISFDNDNVNKTEQVIQYSKPSQATSSQTISLQNLWIENDIPSEGENGLLIHIDFQTTGLEGESGLCVAHFYDEDMNALKSNGADNYHNSNNDVLTSEQFRSRYPVSCFNDFKLYIPYSALQMNNDRVSRLFKIFFLQTDNGQTGVLSESDVYAFDRSSNTLEKVNLTPTIPDTPNDGSGWKIFFIIVCVIITIVCLVYIFGN